MLRHETVVLHLRDDTGDSMLSDAYARSNTDVDVDVDVAGSLKFLHYNLSDAIDRDASHFQSSYRHLV